MGSGRAQGTNGEIAAAMDALRVAQADHSLPAAWPAFAAVAKELGSLARAFGERPPRLLCDAVCADTHSTAMAFELRSRIALTQPGVRGYFEEAPSAVAPRARRVSSHRSPAAQSATASIASVVVHPWTATVCGAAARAALRAPAPQCVPPRYEVLNEHADPRVDWAGHA
jgi:hypothetical protein